MKIEKINNVKIECTKEELSILRKMIGKMSNKDFMKFGLTEEECSAVEDFHTILFNNEI